MINWGWKKDDPKGGVDRAVNIFDEATNIQMKADAIYMNNRVVMFLTENYEWSESLQRMIDTIEAQTKEYEAEMGIKRCTPGRI